MLLNRGVLVMHFDKFSIFKCGFSFIEEFFDDFFGEFGVLVSFLFVFLKFMMQSEN